MSTCGHCGTAIRPDGNGWWIHDSDRYSCESVVGARENVAHPALVPCRAEGPLPCLTARAARAAEDHASRLR